MSPSPYKDVSAQQLFWIKTIQGDQGWPKTNELSLASDLHLGCCLYERAQYDALCCHRGGREARRCRTRFTGSRFMRFLGERRKVWCRRASGVVISHTRGEEPGRHRVKCSCGPMNAKRTGSTRGAVRDSQLRTHSVRRRRDRASATPMHGRTPTGPFARPPAPDTEDRMAAPSISYLKLRSCLRC